MYLFRYLAISTLVNYNKIITIKTNLINIPAIKKHLIKYMTIKILILILRHENF